MAPFMVRGTANPAGEGARNGKAAGEEIVSEPSISNAQRRKLGDISNLPRQAKPINHGAKQPQNQQNRLLYFEEYMEKLQKENTALMKFLAERNRIIELGSIELQKLRVNLQKMQEQNLQLAQANTQMLVELNTNKDRLKALQHELGCKNGLLKARKMQLEKQTMTKIHTTSEDEVQARDLREADEAFQADGASSKNSKRKKQSRTKSLGNIKSVPVHEKANKKRRVSRRNRPLKSEETDNTDVPKEKSQIEDNVDNKELLADGPNQIRETVDNKMFVDEASLIPENLDSKRRRATRQSAKLDFREAEQTEDLHEMDDAKETKENERLFLRQSTCVKGQAPEPSENLHEVHKVTETTQSRRCSVRRQSIDSKCEELESAKSLQETHDTKERTGKQRTSTRRQSTNQKQHQTAAAAEAIMNTIAAEECSSLPEPSTEVNETKETGRTSVGRPSRHAASKVQSYKEISLKVKMRRPE